MPTGDTGICRGGNWDSQQLEAGEDLPGCGLFAVPGCSCSEPPARILPSVWVQGAPPGAARLQGLTLQVLAPKSSSPLQAQQHIPKARADATSSPLAPKLRHAWWLPQPVL